MNLIDTAGLRRAADVVEEEGIRRAKAEMQRADRVLYVLDATLPEQLQPAELQRPGARCPRHLGDATKSI